MMTRLFCFWWLARFLNCVSLPPFRFLFSHQAPPTHRHHRHRGRGLYRKMGAATAHTGKWMGEEGIPGLASVEFEILISILVLVLIGFISVTD